MTDASFIDFEAYQRAVYSPPPALVALGEQDAFWRTLGGSVTDPWGDGSEAIRQRRTAAERKAPGGCRRPSPGECP